MQKNSGWPPNDAISSIFLPLAYFETFVIVNFVFGSALGSNTKRLKPVV